MDRSQRTKEKEKVTIYFDKRAFEQQEEEEKQRQEELEEQEKKEAGIKVVASLFAFFTKPLILMLLWNWLMPGIFSIATIGYLKAFGLYLMSRILFDKND